jgi:hypothetical protein
MTAMPIATPLGDIVAAEGDGLIRALDTSVVQGRYDAVPDAGSR